jgi:hypothetical protein
MSVSTADYSGRVFKFAIISSFLLTTTLFLAACRAGGGGSSTPPISNPVPSITGLSPSSATAGAAAQTLNINGANFLASSTVAYNTVAHTATFVNSAQLKISLTAGDQATAGTYPVVVTNPPPGGGSSNADNFTVNTPPITSVSVSCDPALLQVGQASQCTATVTGTGSYGSTVTWSASAGTIDPNGKFTALANAGSVTVTARSTEDTTKSGTATVMVTLQPTPPAAVQKIYTEHLGMLTGSVLNPLAPVGLIGADLGSSFERDGKLVFLFGDNWEGSPSLYPNGDPVAWTDPLINPLVSGVMPQLQWFMESPGQFLPVRLPGVDMGAMNVPVEGVPLGSETYVFAATGSPPGGAVTQSALAHTDGLAFDSLVLDYLTASDKFLNVSVVENGSTLWIFGSGTYRASAVYLAKVPSAQIADRNAWTYFSGYQQGEPVFGTSESSAVPVVSASCVGELSVRLHEGFGYLMAYNCDNPRGINLRFANQPAGPWSAATVMFDPGADRGYGFFMHQMESVVGYDDGLSDPGREDEWGGEYGPYMIPHWTTSDASGVFSIVYALSSWNPYKVHLVRTIVAQAGVSASPPPPKGTGLSKATLVNGDFATGDLSGWQSDPSGDLFLVQPVGAEWRLTTNVLSEGGPGVEGAIWQDFTVDSKTHELRFAVSGGSSDDATVSVKLVLIATGDVVRASRGPGSSTSRQVQWLLDDLHGEIVRLLIEDRSLTSYVTTTGFTFVQDRMIKKLRCPATAPLLKGWNR